MYLHKTSTAIDYMLTEALVKANHVYKFEECIDNPERYLQLMHDDLIRVLSRSKNPSLQDSVQLLKRIENRDLYKVCGENIINEEQKASVEKYGQ